MTLMQWEDHKLVLGHRLESQRKARLKNQRKAPEIHHQHPLDE
jgi:hypothetical protein